VMDGIPQIGQTASYSGLNLPPLTKLTTGQLHYDRFHSSLLKFMPIDLSVTKTG